jgi:hypothetical protein
MRKTILVTVLMLVLTIVFLSINVAAANPPHVVTSWINPAGNSLVAVTGEQPELYVEVHSTVLFRLTIAVRELVPGSLVVRQVITNVPFGGSTTRNYQGTFPIDTAGLFGNYIVEVVAESICNPGQVCVDAATVSLAVIAPSNTPPNITTIGGIPVGTAIPQIQFTEGVAGSFTVAGYDANNDSLSYEARGQSTRICNQLDSFESFLCRLLRAMNNPTFLGAGASSRQLPAGAGINAQTGVFSWTPPFDFVIHQRRSKEVVVEVRACDSKDCTNWLPVRLQVDDVNRDPVITSTPGVSATENVEYRYQINVNDPDQEDSQDYELLQNPAGMVIDSNGLLRWTPARDAFENSPGGYDIRLRVHDNAYGPGQGGFVDQAWRIVVVDVPNQVPMVITPGNQTVNEDALLEFTISGNDNDGDAVVYEIDQLPSGANFDTQTGLFSWTPAITQITHPLRNTLVRPSFRACDLGGCSPWQLVQITVNDENQQVLVTSVPGAAASEGVEYRYNILASDLDVEDVLSYTLLDGPMGLNLGALGLITWTPGTSAFEDGPNYFVNVSIADNAYGLGTGHNVIHSWQITVNDSGNGTGNGSMNNPPVLNLIGDRVVAEGDELRFRVTASDADGDALSYSISGLPAGASFVAQEFVWMPIVGARGIYQVTFTVQDGQGGQDSEVVNIEVIERVGNRDPVLDLIGNQQVQEGNLLTFNVNAVDPDNDTLTYSVPGLPTGASFNGQTFSWNPSVGSRGVYRVTFTVQDGRGGQDSEVVEILVFSSNRGPVFEVLPNFTINEGTELRFRVNAVDPDNDTLNYRAEGLPQGAIFAGQEFVWTPSFDQSGVYTIDFFVFDGSTLEMMNVMIRVVDVNQPPIITSGPVITGTVDVDYIYVVEAFDPEGVALTYALVSGPSGMSMSSEGVVSWRPYSEGVFVVEVSVSDGVNVVNQRYSILVKKALRGRNLAIMRAGLSSSVVIPGEYVTMFFTTENNGNENLRNLRGRALMYDLTARSTVAQFSLKVGHSSTREVYIEVPYDAYPGVYLIQLRVGNDEFHDTIYRQITVI